MNESHKGPHCDGYCEGTAYNNEIHRLREQLDRAHGRIYDMALCDDGQAFIESERYLERYAPDLYQRLREKEREKANG